MPKDITIRKAKPSDHAGIIAALQTWWGGRDLTAMLPKLFSNLPDFCDLTCFAVSFKYVVIWETPVGYIWNDLHHEEHEDHKVKTH